ncbi:hypothetical protein BUALT_Bualt01G0037000 [Buddleja alternifolia]|uniref:Uncharacterized protein n=1 Tax=Buddleja alternifolia TaxID=168488 RepID=A0AAV6YC33_9LAMI|nr:hypothetical protein BUALT_Bualt01G0037000 [Buddleja alternifolia]
MEVIISPAPSTPQRFGEYYFSAPTTPSHLSHFYNDSDDLYGDGGGGRASSVAFGWEEKPATPKSPIKINNNGDDFAFDVIGDLETASLSAEELFDGGVIKPLKPPPRLQLPPAAGIIILTNNLRHSNKTSPFAVAAQIAAKAASPPQRVRERGGNMSKTSTRRVARSLSPIRDTQYQWNKTKNSSVCSTLAAYKKWWLKDFFLFRSASEGRAAEKDPLKKYTAAFRHSSSNSGSVSRRKGPVSAHEVHYTMNRAVSEDLKRKTFLPYKQGILGRLAFNPAVHALANGFGFSRK